MSFSRFLVERVILLGDEYEALLSDQKNILAVVRKDLEEISAKYGNERRTLITDDGPEELRA